MRSYNQQLQFHALKDLTNRAKSGILIYITIFLILGYVYELPEKEPFFFFSNISALVLIMIFRVSHYIVLNKMTNPNVELMNQWLVITVLGSALHWGGMTAWIIQAPSLAPLEFSTMVILPAFALGGSCTLCISAEIRTLYPSLMFIPPVATLAIQGGTENFMLGSMATFALIYTFAATRTAHNDYWEAITNHMVAEERAELMEKLSTTDPLTQLKNRMFFDAELKQEWKRSSRMGSPLSLIMIDLDYFKRINDTYGHIHGDECLRKVAATIAHEAKRPTDCSARYGGEEFVVLLPNTDKEGSKVIAERILNAIAELHFEINGTAIPLSCSIGGTTRIPHHQEDRTILIRDADSALYYAKENGRGRYCAYDEIPAQSKAD